MTCESAASRFRHLPTVWCFGREIPIAKGIRVRLLGLAGLQPEEAGAGLLIPRCSSVHTFGMRFALDIVFLDRCGGPLSIRRGVSGCRVVSDRRAYAALELPSLTGGAQ